MSAQDKSELLQESAKLLAKANHALTTLQLDIKELQDEQRGPRAGMTEYNQRLQKLRESVNAEKLVFNEKKSRYKNEINDERNYDLLRGALENMDQDENDQEIEANMIEILNLNKPEDTRVDDTHSRLDTNVVDQNLPLNEE